MFTQLKCKLFQNEILTVLMCNERLKLVICGAKSGDCFLLQYRVNKNQIILGENIQIFKSLLNEPVLSGDSLGEYCMVFGQKHSRLVDIESRLILSDNIKFDRYQHVNDITLHTVSHEAGPQLSTVHFTVCGPKNRAASSVYSPISCFHQVFDKSLCKNLMQQKVYDRKVYLENIGQSGPTVKLKDQPVAVYNEADPVPPNPAEKSHQPKPEKKPPNHKPNQANRPAKPNQNPRPKHAKVKILPHNFRVVLNSIKHRAQTKKAQSGHKPVKPVQKPQSWQSKHSSLLQKYEALRAHCKQLQSEHRAKLSRLRTLNGQLAEHNLELTTRHAQLQNALSGIHQSGPGLDQLGSFQTLQQSLLACVCEQMRSLDSAKTRLVALHKTLSEQISGHNRLVRALTLNHQIFRSNAKSQRPESAELQNSLEMEKLLDDPAHSRLSGSSSLDQFRVVADSVSFEMPRGIYSRWRSDK